MRSNEDKEGEDGEEEDDSAIIRVKYITYR
jgi:hypothetical protein